MTGLVLAIGVLTVFNDANAAELKRKASDDYGTTYWGSFENAPFPAKGKSYKDDTVAVFVPDHFCPVIIKASPKKKGKGLRTKYECYSDRQLKKLKKEGYRTRLISEIDIVIHFHGHSNTVDKAMANHKLREQFAMSLQNAILVVPQGPVNSIDSAGGKLEQSGGLKRLTRELLSFMKEQKIAGKKASIGRIILSSHSGGYRVAAFCLRVGGVEVSEMFLFDSLYGHVDNYFDWVKGSKSRRLISVYYRDKPRARSMDLMKLLKNAGIGFARLQEADMAKESFKRKTLTKHRIFFIETDLGHSGCTRGYFAFRDYLFASRLKRVRDTDWFKQTGLDKM